MKGKYTTIDEYIQTNPPEIQPVLEKIRQTIHKAAPEATETISYQMPAFKMKRVLVYFAGHKTYIGFYPTGSGIEAFKKELAGYKWSKGAVQFPLDKPMPFDLIKKMVAFRVKEDAKL